MAQHVRWSEVGPGVGQVVLDAPPRNIFNSESWQELEAALAALRSRGTRVIVIGSVAHLAGETAALRLVLDGRPISGDEALRLGLVHRVADGGQALGEALGWAEWLASRPPWALAANKALVKGTRALSLRDGLRREIEAFAELASRDDVLALVREAQDRYDAGGDSHDAFGVPADRPTEQDR